MVLGGMSLTEANDGTAVSAEKDQVACVCRLILIYTL